MVHKIQNRSSLEDIQPSDNTKVELNQISTLARHQRAHGPHPEVGRHSYNLRCAGVALVELSLWCWRFYMQRSGFFSKEPSGPQRRGAGSPGKRQPDKQHPGRGSFELLCPLHWHRCECRPTAAPVQRACGGGPADGSCSHTSRSPRPPAAQPCLAHSCQPGVSQARCGRPVSVQEKDK